MMRGKANIVEAIEGFIEQNSKVKYLLSVHLFDVNKYFVILFSLQSIVFISYDSEQGDGFSDEKNTKYIKGRVEKYLCLPPYQYIIPIIFF